MADFTKPWKHSDQILTVDECDLHVHRSVLSLWSPVFDRMFNSGFKESTSERVILHNKKYTEIREMLEIIYDRTKQVTDDNFLFLLELSEEYQMEQLRNECVKFINSANKAGIEAIKYYACAERFRIEDVKSECAKQLACIPHKLLKNTESYVQADDVVKNMILQARIESLENLIDRFRPVLIALLTKMYHCAHSEFDRYLRDKGLEESVLSRCSDYDEHTNKKIGQKFDMNCKSCRKNSMVSKEFVVNTKETNTILEQLYLLTEQMETMTTKNSTKIDSKR